MNKETQLEAIRQKCIAANPEIVELKFGCKIKTRWHTDAVILGYSKRKSTRTEEWYHYRHGVTTSTCIRGSIIEVIGRPIRLADVLLVLQLRLGGMVLNDEVQEQRYEKFREEVIQTVGMWNKRADDLTQQSPETIAFLYELLKS